MRFLHLGSLAQRFVLVGTLLFGGVGLLLQGQDSKDRVVRNAWEVHRELRIAPEAQSAVKDYFLSFLEYQDIVMFHEKVGYYSSGRVSFTSDYQTYPIVLAPLFGHMVAEQMLFMFEGMRKAETLSDKEQFTIAEFGPGDGALAESILTYFEEKAKTDARWRQFQSQLLYICYDRSPALNDIQRERNKRFGSHFAARVADATNPNATIPVGSLKGVVLSNELPDAFSVHKIILSPNGTVEIAFVVPTLPDKTWETIRPLIPAAAAKKIADDDLAVEKKFFAGTAFSNLYLTRSTFVPLFESLLPTKEYESVANAMEFQEVYVPVSVIPEVATHLKRYASVYAGVLARDPRGFVSYINPGVESFIDGSAKALKAGYMLTIDYGTTWNGILSDDSHLRTYGPAHKGGGFLDAAGGGDPEIHNPYLGPTLNDMTTDVNFSLMAVEGESVGLKPMYFGSQRALQTGTSVSFVPSPPNRHEKFDAWTSDFLGFSVYKVFVQQKEGTDKKYLYPDKEPESLGLDQTLLTEAQRLRAAEIQRLLAGTPLVAPQR